MAEVKSCARCKGPITHKLLVQMDYGYCCETCREREILGIPLDEPTKLAALRGWTVLMEEADKQALERSIMGPHYDSLVEARKCFGLQPEEDGGIDAEAYEAATAYRRIVK